MTTVFRIKNTQFNNPAFPLVSPFVRNGLKGAFRPMVDASTLIDLSGNGGVLTAVGAPALTSQGIIGDIANGYVTNIADTPSHTIIVTGRVNLTGASGAFSGIFAGNSRQVPTVAYRAGLEVFFHGGPGTSSDLRIALGANTMYTKTATSLPDLATVGNQTVVDNFADTYTPWYFMAITCDAVNNTVAHYVPHINPVTANTVTNITNIGGALATRGLAILPEDTPNYMRIIARVDPGAPTTFKTEVAEALFYDRALTSAEIFEQYALSKTYMQMRKGITI